MLLFAAVGLILLVACANVAGLMLARAAGRERENAVRGALGATPARLVRQMLSESLVLGALAGVVGLIAAAAGLRVLVSLLPANTPRIADISLQWPVYLFAVAAAVFAGVLFGVIPALKVASPNLRDALHAGGRTVTGKAGQFRVSMLLVMGQIALSVVVITAAGLMLHSLWSLSEVNPGFRAGRIVTAEVSLDATACQTKGRCQGFFDALQERLSALPGATGVALTDSLPLSGRDDNYVYDAEGHPRQARQGALMATGRVVTPGYFSTLGMSLVRGRALEAQDASGVSRAVVISESMAARLWPHENPLGRHIENVDDEPTPTVWNPTAAQVVVGVVSNAHEGSLAGAVSDDVYLPMSPAQEEPVMYVLLRTQATTQEAASELRQVVGGIDPQAPVTRIRTLNEVVAASESAPRSLTVLLLAFGGLALMIGSVGVYSLVAYIVRWRTREIGIRLALGAQRGQIVAGMVRQSLLLALGGCGVGLAVATPAAHLLRRFLFGVKAVDPVTFVGVAVLMTGLTLTAAWIPARRAASVDPIETLRME